MILDLRKAFPWLRGHAAGFADESRTSELVDGLRANGFHLYFLDGERISDTASFFLEVERALELPPYFGRNWNAFIDSLGDFEIRSARRVAVIWRHAESSATSDLAVFVEAVHWFLAIGADLRTTKPRGGELTQLELLLVGNAPGFREGIN